MAMSTTVAVRDINPHLTCPLCRGYLIDATTVVECVHSFCRSCLLKHLRKDACCPSCKHLLNAAKPDIKPDKTLQDIVYKLVPGLCEKEMRRRREFYSKNPEAGFAANQNHLGGANGATPEQRGNDVSGGLIFSTDDAISLSLEYEPVGTDLRDLLSGKNDAESELNNAKVNRRYLQCPALVTIAHLKKFLSLKYSVDMTRYSIDIKLKTSSMPDHWTLIDAAYSCSWKRNAPIRFFYSIKPEKQLEAPPNDRPSTPGLGASQPVASEQAVQPALVQGQKPKREDEIVVKQPTKEIKAAPQAVVKHPLSTKKTIEVKKNEPQEMLAKRSSPPFKELTKTTEINDKPLAVSAVTKAEEAMNKVKSPVKIMKNSDGVYQVVSKLSAPVKTEVPEESLKITTSAKVTAPPTPAEFSVKQVSIGDGANSNGVKITLKQCSPGTASNGSPSSKKPKVISNVLLGKSTKTNIVEKIQDLQKQEKQKRKAGLADGNTSPSKQMKKPNEQADKKQFLQGFRLTTNKTNEPEKLIKKDTQLSELSVEDQVKSIIKNSLANKGLQNQKLPEDAKKNQSDVKVNSTNIADRLADSKQLVSTPENTSSQAISSSNDKKQPQQPVDVYAFPGDPPPIVSGAVKRKCPPGLPIFNKTPKNQTGKRAGVNTARGGAVKCYRNQSVKTVQPICPKPPASPTKPLQNVPNLVINTPNTNTNTNTGTVSPSPAVTSTSSKPKQNMSPDTRTLLDGCGLNIPKSLSITLTAPKSPTRDNTSEARGKEVARQNPSITLNNETVDPKVLKALGQMKVPGANAKTKSKPVNESMGPPPKRKKEQQSPQQPRNILDLSGQKKIELPSLKIPTPLGKFKVKPPQNWTQSKSPKTGAKDDSPNFANSQVVTLMDGQKFYRAPPGSLTPAAHRIGDIPTPTRAPVYAPFFSSPASSPKPAPNLSSVFPSLQSLYALSQAPNLEQYHMDARMRMNAVNKDNNSPKSLPNTAQVNKSHLAAQCAPIKPARSSVGSFAVPIAKQLVSGGLSIKAVGNNSNKAAAPAPATPTAAVSVGESETSASSTDSNNTDQKTKANDNATKEAPSKSDSKQNEKCASSTEESNCQQGAASPRVTSTVSPSPPPSVSETVTNSEEKSSAPSESEKSQSSSGAEVTSTNKSPESPDSSSVVTENIGNPADSTKTADKSKNESPAETVEIKSSDKEQKSDVKLDSKNIESVEFKKPMTSEALQERFLAAFPSNEWANNPVAAKQFGNFLKSLSTMQAEAQPKNAKSIE